MYRPETFVVTSKAEGQRQGNLANLVRRFLVMRWESSPAAFHETLKKITLDLKAKTKSFEKDGVFIPSAGVDPVSGIVEDEGEGTVYAKPSADVTAYAGRETRSFTDALATKFVATMKSDAEVLDKVEAQFLAAGLDDPAKDGKLASLLVTVDEIGLLVVEILDANG